MKWYFEGFRKYAAFQGRSRRKEFWYFLLFNILALLVLVVVDGAVGTLSFDGGIGWLSGLYLLAIAVPSVAVSVRRLHDTDRSGWWFWINLIPITGAIVFFVFATEPGELDPNQYGANPKRARAKPEPRVHEYTRY